MSALTGRVTEHVRGDVLVVVAVLVAASFGTFFVPNPWHVFVVPGAAVLLVLFARWHGFRWEELGWDQLGWDELGLARMHWGRGARHGLMAAGLVIFVVAIGALLPATRPFFLADRYSDLSNAIFASLVLIPVQTAIPEEILFRGVAFAALGRAYGRHGAMFGSAFLFGLWHISSSWNLTATNKGLGDLVGTGGFGQAVGIVATVIATFGAGLVFAWLRRRSGSLLPSIALHWALNGVGAIAAALVWRASV